MPSCIECYPLCSACTGTANLECTACKNDPSIYSTTPTPSLGCECSSYYYYSNNIRYCDDCYGLCVTCNGPTNTDCPDQVCKNSPGVITIAGGCACNTSYYYYNSSTRNCETCHPICVQCSGPTNSECSSCISHATVEPTPIGCKCKDPYYYNTITQ